MVNQNAVPSDSEVVSENISKFGIGGSGNVGISNPSDSMSVSESIMQSSQPLTVVLNSTFQRLTSRDLWRAGVSSVSDKERYAVVDVTFPSNIVYTTGGVVVDFSQIQRFKTVYLCKAFQNSYANVITFVPDANNASNNGKLKFFNNTGTELVNGSTAIQSVTCRCWIRGL